MMYNLINNLTAIDKILAKVLKVAASAIPPSLTEIFNQFPSYCETERVIPLPKKDQRSVLDIVLGQFQSVVTKIMVLCKSLF